MADEDDAFLMSGDSDRGKNKRGLLDEDEIVIVQETARAASRRGRGSLLDRPEPEISLRDRVRFHMQADLDDITPDVVPGPGPPSIAHSAYPPAPPHPRHHHGGPPVRLPPPPMHSRDMHHPHGIPGLRPPPGFGGPGGYHRHDGGPLPPPHPPGPYLPPPAPLPPWRMALPPRGEEEPQPDFSAVGEQLVITASNRRRSGDLSSGGPSPKRKVEPKPRSTADTTATGKAAMFVRPETSAQTSMVAQAASLPQPPKRDKRRESQDSRPWIANSPPVTIVDAPVRTRERQPVERVQVHVSIKQEEPRVDDEAHHTVQKKRKSKETHTHHEGLISSTAAEEPAAKVKKVRKKTKETPEQESDPTSIRKHKKHRSGVKQEPAVDQAVVMPAEEQQPTTSTSGSTRNRSSRDSRGVKTWSSVDVDDDPPDEFIAGYQEEPPRRRSHRHEDHVPSVEPRLDSSDARPPRVKREPPEHHEPPMEPPPRRHDRYEDDPREAHDQRRDRSQHEARTQNLRFEDSTESYREGHHLSTERQQRQPRMNDDHRSNRQGSRTDPRAEDPYADGAAVSNRHQRSDVAWELPERPQRIRNDDYDHQPRQQRPDGNDRRSPGRLRDEFYEDAPDADRGHRLYDQLDRLTDYAPDRDLLLGPRDTFYDVHPSRQGRSSQEEDASYAKRERRGSNVTGHDNDTRRRSNDDRAYRDYNRSLQEAYQHPEEAARRRSETEERKHSRNNTRQGSAESDQTGGFSLRSAVSSAVTIPNAGSRRDRSADAERDRRSQGSIPRGSSHTSHHQSRSEIPRNSGQYRDHRERRSSVENSRGYPIPPADDVPRGISDALPPPGVDRSGRLRSSVAAVVVPPPARASMTPPPQEPYPPRHEQNRYYQSQDRGRHPQDFDHPPGGPPGDRHRPMTPPFLPPPGPGEFRRPFNDPERDRNHRGRATSYYDEPAARERPRGYEDSRRSMDVSRHRDEEFRAPMPMDHRRHSSVHEPPFHDRPPRNMGPPPLPPPPEPPGPPPPGFFREGRHASVQHDSRSAGRHDNFRSASEFNPPRHDRPSGRHDNNMRPPPGRDSRHGARGTDRPPQFQDGRDRPPCERDERSARSSTRGRGDPPPGRNDPRSGSRSQSRTSSASGGTKNASDKGKGEMPEHIRWLHDRWAKYDNSFFASATKSSTAARTKPGGGPRDNEERRRVHNEYRESYRSNGRDSHGRLSMGGARRVESMMSFKEYLLSIPHEIEDFEEARRKYDEYKLKFKREAYLAFFKQHEHDEWFRGKYHPVARQETERRRTMDVRLRLDVFMQLLITGIFEVPLDTAHSREIRKVLDSACILLDGGTISEIRQLSDLDYALEEQREDQALAAQATGLGDPAGGTSGGGPAGSDGEIGAAGEGGEGGTEGDGSAGSGEKVPGPAPTNSALDPVQMEIMQHARDYSMFQRPRDMSELPLGIKEVGGAKKNVAVPSQNKPTGITRHKCVCVLLRDLPSSMTQADLVHALQLAQEGLLRVRVFPPDPANKFRWSGVASFRYSVDIGRLLRGLANAKYKGITLGAYEYLPPVRKRILLVSGIAADRSVLLRDVQLARRMIEHLDQKHNLWQAPPKQPDAADVEAGEVDDTAKPTGTPASAVDMVNPLLVNLDNCLQFHMDKLMEDEQRKQQDKAHIITAGGELVMGPDGTPVGPSDASSGAPEVQFDANLAKILDRMLLYLRIVHSVDYYGTSFYEQENSEPRRIGQMTVRGLPNVPATPKNLATYIKEAEEALEALFPPPEARLADEHVELLGKRNREQELERLMTESVKHLWREKLYKCTICNKRFQSERFVEEHLRSRHVDRLKEADIEAEYFNNYLYDPNRPCDAMFN